MSGNHKRKRRAYWVDSRVECVQYLLKVLYKLGIKSANASYKAGLAPAAFRSRERLDSYSFTDRIYEQRRREQKL